MTAITAEGYETGRRFSLSSVLKSIGARLSRTFKLSEQAEFEAGLGARGL